MGTLYYSTAPPVTVPERLLAHLRVVATVKLRRNERFTVSIAPSDGDEGGTTMLWLGPDIPLRFEFDTDEAEPLDPVLLHELALQANTARGIVLRIDPAPVAELVGA